MNDSDRDRILRVNHLADSVGLEASLEDAGGAEESFSEAELRHLLNLPRKRRLSPS